MTPPIKRPLLLHGPPPPLPLSVDSMEGVSRMLLFILSFALVHHLFALIRLFPWSLVGVCVPRVACTYDGWGRNEDAVAFDARAHTHKHTHTTGRSEEAAASRRAMRSTFSSWRHLMRVLRKLRCACDLAQGWWEAGREGCRQAGRQAGKRSGGGTRDIARQDHD